MPPARTPRSRTAASPSAPEHSSANKLTKAALTKSWIEKAALAQDSKGNWVAARSVHAWKEGDPPFRITFTADMSDDTQCQQHSLALLEDEAKRPLKKIMMGFFGTPIDAKGMHVTPKSLLLVDADGGKKQSVVAFQVSDASGVAVGAEARMGVQDFLDKFGVSAAGPKPVGTFDFAKYPGLLAVMQEAGILGPSKSVLPRGPAWEALAVFSGSPVADDSAAQSAAESAERAASSSKASPERSKLKALIEFGGLKDATVAQRAGAVKRLALAHDDESDDGEDEPVARKPKKARSARGEPAAKAASSSASKPAIVEEDDSEGSGSSSSDEEERARPSKRTKKNEKDLDEDEEAFNDEPATLGWLVPPGWSLLDAARIIFEHEKVRAAAAADAVPAAGSEDAGAASRLGRRYELAFRRLVGAIGTAWIGRDVPSAREGSRGDPSRVCAGSVSMYLMFIFIFLPF